MKTVVLALALTAAASAALAQDVASTLSSAADPQELPRGPRGAAIPKLSLTATTTIVAPPLEATYEPVAGQATVRLGGVYVQVQTLPASRTVLITFTTPPQQQAGLLELVEVRTGQVIYTGSVLTNDGQIELPVADPNQPFEVRLATDHDVVIARMAP